MSAFKNFFSGLTLPSKFSNLFNGTGGVSVSPEDGANFYLLNGQEVNMPFKTSFDIVQGIPHMGAVVSKGCEMFSTVRFKIVRTDTEEEEIVTDHHLNRLLQQPNNFYTWKQLLYITYMYKLCTGASFLLPGFGINRTPSRLAFISFIDFDTYNKNINQWARPYANATMDEVITSIDFYFKYTTGVSLKTSDLMWIRDANVSYIDDYSRVQSLEQQALNIYKALVARGILIDKKGGIGMIAGNQKDSGQSVPLAPKERKKIQRALGEYGLGNNKEPIIVTDVPLKYTPFVFPTRELMLFEEITDDFNTICDRMGINRELFDGQTTFANKRMAETSTYTNTILPAWVDFFALLNEKLNTKLENIVIQPDFSHVEALQQNARDQVDTDSKKSTMLINELTHALIDENEYRQQMGYKALPIVETVDESKEVPSDNAEQAALRSSVGGVQGILAVQAGVSAGTTTRDAALSIFTIIYGFTDQQANDLLGAPADGATGPLPATKKNGHVNNKIHA